jgi:hypothetical protein
MSGVPEVAAETALLYWAYERGQDAQKSQWASWRMPSWTNTSVFPGGRNDPEILEAEDDLTEDEFNRQYGGMFVERIGRVMSQWDDEAHLTDLSYNPTMPLYAALDYGYTNDWVWLWIQQDMWGQVYVIGEERWRMMDTEEVCTDILNKRDRAEGMWSLLDKVNIIYAPPAEPSDTSIVQRKLSRPIRTNTGGELNERDRMTNGMLKLRPSHLPDGHPSKKPGILFDRSRTHQLAWEMRTGYRWPEHKNENKNASENPLDKDNHGPEALGRFVKGHLGKTQERRTSRQSTVRARRS